MKTLPAVHILRYYAERGYVLYVCEMLQAKYIIHV